MTRIAWLLAAGLLVWTVPTPAAADAKEEANKKAVVEFYVTALNRKDFETAAKFFGPRYVQHNPMAPDGIEGFKTFLGFLREKFPQSRSEIKRVWAEGDYVILHVHAVRTPGPRLGDRGHLQAGERQDRGALGRDPGDSREGGQQ